MPFLNLSKEIAEKKKTASTHEDAIDKEAKRVEFIKRDSRKHRAASTHEDALNKERKRVTAKLAQGSHHAVIDKVKNEQES